ncbi:MAG: hypothetical protein AB1644_00455 [Candidatus Zixiibacteriota bacterium]
MHDGNGLVRTIEIKDKHGRVVEIKEVVTYAGLLNRAHQEGLKSIRTRLVQRPSAENEMTAISLAEVVTDKGVFRDYGDANPTNVTARIAPHIIRMSVTRAKARALRDAINVGVMSLEELGQEYVNGNGHAVEGNGSTRARRADGDRPLTDNQRKYLFRLLDERGVNAEEGDAWLCRTCGVAAVTDISRKQASEVIDQLVGAAAGTPAGEERPS